MSIYDYDQGNQPSAKLLQRERESANEWLRIQEKTAAHAAACEECALLAGSVLAAILKIRAVLSERSRAATAGLIDDMNFLEQQTEINEAFSERDAAVDTYVHHTEEKHGLVEHYHGAPTN